MGVGSVGWAVIQVDETKGFLPEKIVGMGSRIVPLSVDDANEFSAGRAITKNRSRTQKRTARKGYDRYQLRRSYLLSLLEELGMKPDEALWRLPMNELWQLRSDAATEGNGLSLMQIGRVLCHLNQKRGYRHSKAEVEEEGKKQSEYLEAVNSRYREILEKGLTVGQFFNEKLKQSEVKTPRGSSYATFRVKEQVFPRQAYIDEFDTIMAVQRKSYPGILTDEVIDELRNRVIFYQRPLKSCKHLVSLCDYEKRQYRNAEGKWVWSGPKVAPKTSPLFQVCRIWESLNNLSVRNRNTRKRIEPTIEQKSLLFDFLDNNAKGETKQAKRKNPSGGGASKIQWGAAVRRLFEIMDLDPEEGWYVEESVERNLQDNQTKLQLRSALKGLDKKKADALLRFELHEQDSDTVDTQTGEVLPVVSADFEKEPLYRLWHLIYSVQEKDLLFSALRKDFGIDDETVLEALFKLDFVKPGYGNKSSKNMRKILPWLMRGKRYSEACDAAGFSHSGSLTKEENRERELLPVLPLLPKNALRQPVVEKILNQMIHVVNQVQSAYGKMDEIHVELARELKKSREERYEDTRLNSARKKENDRIAKLVETYGLYPSKSKIEKYRLWEESEHRCFYCGEMIGVKEFLTGVDAEVEHIIPRSLFFDNGFSNKVCSCRKCNAEKGNDTAYDFMERKGGALRSAYLNRVEEFAKAKKISKTKKRYLLMPKDEIPQDFIERQLRLSQYISRKSAEILLQTCRDVLCTGGSITATARKLWGYNDILHDLNLERFRQAGLTEFFEVEHKGQMIRKERIVDWDKRSDHRHHAVDALVVASTRRSFVQRINTLNASREDLHDEVSEHGQDWKGKMSLLEAWIVQQPHFSVSQVSDAAAGILVSFKAGKRVATKAKRYVYKKGKRVLVQSGILVPRGALCEESVYGKIHRLVRKPVEDLFADPEHIVKPYIRKLVEERLRQFDGNAKKARASVKKDPILIHAGKEELRYASCYESEYVIRYPVGSVVNEKETKEDKIRRALSAVVDGKIRNLMYERIKSVDFKVSEAFKEPLWLDSEKTIPVRSVRCYTGLSVVEPIRFDKHGEAEAFVKPGNNHHVAVYEDSEGRLQEHVVTFWYANERRRYDLPVVIENPYAVWEELQGRQDIPDTFWEKLPDREWKFRFSMQQNEMFVLGMPEDLFGDAVRNRDGKMLARYLYRVQKLAVRNYYFRYHVETSVSGDNKQTLAAKNYYCFKSLSSLMAANPHKLKINAIGGFEIMEK